MPSPWRAQRMQAVETPLARGRAPREEPQPAVCVQILILKFSQAANAAACENLEYDILYTDGGILPLQHPLGSCQALAVGCCPACAN